MKDISHPGDHGEARATKLISASTNYLFCFFPPPLLSPPLPLPLPPLSPPLPDPLPPPPRPPPLACPPCPGPPPRPLLDDLPRLLAPRPPLLPPPLPRLVLPLPIMSDSSGSWPTSSLQQEHEAAGVSSANRAPGPASLRARDPSAFAAQALASSCIVLPLQEEPHWCMLPGFFYPLPQITTYQPTFPSRSMRHP